MTSTAARKLVKKLGEAWEEVLEAERAGRIDVSLTPKAANMVEQIKQNPSGLEMLVENAKSDPHADMAIRQYAVSLIDSDAALPAVIKPLVMSMLLGKRPPRPKGRKSVGLANVVRDTFILVVAEELENKFKIPPTRNPGTETECGCSMAVRELERRGFKIKEAGAVEVYGKRKKFWGPSG